MEYDLLTNDGDSCANAHCEFIPTSKQHKCRKEKYTHSCGECEALKQQPHEGSPDVTDTAQPSRDCTGPRRETWGLWRKGCERGWTVIDNEQQNVVNWYLFTVNTCLILNLLRHTHLYLSIVKCYYSIYFIPFQTMWKFMFLCFLLTAI